MKRLLRRIAFKILGISFADTVIVNRLNGVIYFDDFRNAWRIVNAKGIGEVDRYTQRIEIVVVNLGNSLEGIE